MHLKNNNIHYLQGIFGAGILVLPLDWPAISNSPSARKQYSI